MALTRQQTHRGQVVAVTVDAALGRLHQRFAVAGVPTPEVDAELLIRHVLGWSRARLLTGRREPLAAAAAERLERLAARRAAREPLQLLVGSVGFRSLEIEVRPGVFVPRPETEVLAGEAVDRTPPGGVVVEPFTGTGAVACAVAAETRAAVLASDLSPAAVALARANAARLGLPVDVGGGDLFAPLPRRLRGRVDVVVSNPPYLAEAELVGLQPEVTEWDPVQALVSGPTGCEAIDRLIAEAPQWLRPGGWLLCEVDSSRADRHRAALVDRGWAECGVLADLTGAPRIVVGRHRS